MTRSAKHQRRWDARRRVLPGFPVVPRPFTLEEVRDYFSSDKITCLLCGKQYLRISAQHLREIHEIDEDTYRERYGLPWRRGLTGVSAHEKYRAAGLQRLEEGTFQPGDPTGTVHMVPRRPRAPYRSELGRHNLNQGAPPPPVYDPNKVMPLFLERVAAGRTPAEVYSDADMPCKAWFTDQFKRGARAELLGVIFAQPYAFQAAAQFGLSPQFYSEVRTLRSRGLSDHQIGERLGVAAMTINRQRRKHNIL
jgi:hypothetical protein